MNKALTVWKWELSPGYTPIDMPVGAKVLAAQEQNGTIMLWALIDAAAETEQRVFAVKGTGHEIIVQDGERYDYIATAQMGWLVWHVFEVCRD